MAGSRRQKSVIAYFPSGMVSGVLLGFVKIMCPALRVIGSL